MLKRFGHNEESIRCLWTLRSILVARLTLLSSYMLLFFPLLLALSRAVLFDACDQAAKVSARP
jgi:hypothetical protein